MLSKIPIIPTLPAVDLERAGRFYEEKLGLELVSQSEGDRAYRCGGGTMLYLYKRSATKADHTVASFIVDDIESQVNWLKEKGISFEEYDMPGLKTKEGIASTEDYKGAWFKDTEGNILALTQFLKPGWKEAISASTPV